MSNIEEKAFREMIGLDTKFNSRIRGILSDIESDSNLFNKKPSEVKYGSKADFGDYKVVEYSDYVFVYNKDSVYALISVYELHGFEIIVEKDLIVVYGHEEVVLFFLDGTLKSIRTR